MDGDLHLKSKEGDTRTAHVTLRKTHIATGSGTIQPKPEAAVRGIVDAFDRFPVVAIRSGEDTHCWRTTASRPLPLNGKNGNLQGLERC